MTLYEINKGLYVNAPDLQDDNGNDIIANFLKKYPSKYYLLLNNELRYYTMYTFESEYKFKDMAKDILSLVKEDLGDIKEICHDGDMLEFWVKSREDDGIYMYALFDYARGVIEI